MPRVSRSTAPARARRAPPAGPGTGRARPPAAPRPAARIDATNGATSRWARRPRRSGSTSSATIALTAADLFAALRHPGVGEGLEVVHVEQGHPVRGRRRRGRRRGERRRRRSAAAGPARAGRTGSRSACFEQHGGGPGRGQQHVGLLQRRGQAAEVARPGRRNAWPGAGRLGPGPVGHQHLRHPAPQPAPGPCPRPSRRRRAPGCVRPSSVPEPLGRQGHRGLRQRRGPPGDAGLGAGPLADLEGVAEQPVSDRPGRALAPGPPPRRGGPGRGSRPRRGRPSRCPTPTWKRWATAASS